jgi:hypothetical protein
VRLLAEAVAPVQQDGERHEHYGADPELLDGEEAAASHGGVVEGRC